MPPVAVKPGSAVRIGSAVSAGARAPIAWRRTRGSPSTAVNASHRADQAVWNDYPFVTP
jgi:hypothetical protein